MEGLAIRSLVNDDIAKLQLIRKQAFRPIFESFRSIVGGRMAAVAFDREDASRRIISRASSHPPTITSSMSRSCKAPSSVSSMFASTGRSVNAIAPAVAGRGIGTRMYKFAFERFRAAGLKVARVSTGGEPRHAPARRAYIKAGFEIGIPGVTFHRTL